MRPAKLQGQIDKMMLQTCAHALLLFMIRELKFVYHVLMLVPLVLILVIVTHVKVVLFCKMDNVFVPSENSSLPLLLALIAIQLVWLAQTEEIINVWLVTLVLTVSSILWIISVSVWVDMSKLHQYSFVLSVTFRAKHVVVFWVQTVIVAMVLTIDITMEESATVWPDIIVMELTKLVYHVTTPVRLV